MKNQLTLRGPQNVENQSIQKRRTPRSLDIESRNKKIRITTTKLIARENGKREDKREEGLNEMIVLCLFIIIYDFNDLDLPETQR